MRPKHAFVGVSIIVLCLGQMSAYKLLGPKWPSPATTFYVDIPGSNGLWNDAFESAMASWNQSTVFKYSIVKGSFWDPCSNPNTNEDRNGVKFADTVCGDAWGSPTLAIAKTWSAGTTIIQSGIVFNSTRSWNVYDGPWNSSVGDFRRVAVHELGHSLGLDHEDGVPAIMNTAVAPGTTITVPQADDINGVNALYGGTTSLPNLTPSQPSGWSDKIVVSTATGTTTDSGSLRSTDQLYVDWALLNAGPAATSARFDIKLYVDGVERQSWFKDPPLQANTYMFVNDYALGTLSAGTHTLRIVADPGSAIAESNELDNEYTKTINVIAPSGVPNLTPYKPDEWSDKIVVSTIPATTTDSTSLRSTDQLYLDWAVLNSGSTATSARFFITLYVDGVERQSWYRDPPLESNFYTFIKDHPLGTLSAGTHVLRIVADSASAIAESNESDNEYTKTITVNLATTNRPPTVNAGADQIVNGGRTVTLAGSGTDPDGDVVTFTWSQRSGSAVSIQNPNNATATFISPRVAQDLDLLFRLTANDGKGGTGADELKVTVLKNKSPVVNPGSDQTVSPGVTVFLNGSATDSDGDNLSYLWTQVSGPSVGSIFDSAKPSATFKAPTASSETGLLFKLAVSDGLATVEALVKITVHPTGNLVFPYSLDKGHPLFRGTFVGVAIANLSGNPDQVTVSALDSSGLEKARVDLISAIGSQGQTAFLSSEIPAGGANSLVVRGSRANLQGFFMVGDAALRRLDGIGGEMRESTALYFPLARHGTRETTLVFLFNPNAQNGSNVFIKLFNQQGVLLRSKDITLPPLGSIVATLDELYGSDLVVTEGFVQVIASLPLKGFEVYARDEDFSSFVGQIGSQTKRLLVPHFFVDAETGNTEIRLLNVGSDKAFVKINAFDDQARSLGTKDVEIGPGSLSILDLKQALALDVLKLKPFEFITGYLVLEVTAERIGIFERTPELIGTVSFGGNQRKFFSSLPMPAEGSTESAFFHVAQSREHALFMGLAIYNPSSTTSRVRLQAFDERGIKTAEKEFDLPAGQRVVGLLNESRFFGSAFSQIKGHLRVSSLSTSANPTPPPLVVFTLFGDEASQYLSAIEAQRPMN